MEISTLANTLSWVHQRLGSLGPLHFLSIPVIWLACHVIYLRYFHPLHSYPGPFWASITPLYRAWQLSSGRYHILVGECTKLYGPVYRDAPNSLMFNDPNFAEAVHGRQGYKKFPKHRFWWSLKVRADDSDLSTLLSRDSEAHTRLKKGVAGAYSFTNIKKFEPLIDEIVDDWLQQLEKRKEVEFGAWGTYIAMDVLTKISLDNQMGFIEKGGDVNNYYASLNAMFPYMAWIGAYEWVVAFLKHPLISPFVEPKASDRLGMGYLYHCVQDAVDKAQRNPNPTNPSIANDLVNGKNSDGAPLITNPIVKFGEILATITGGSDAAAWGISCTISLILQHPRVLSKLQAEIDAADKAGKLSSPVVQYLEGEKLSYVQACIKEALRLYPSFSGRLSRTTTDVGAEVLGRWVPPNTEIGNCLAVSNRIKAIYGKDAEDFVPERWLPLDGERAKEMNKYLGTFGYGVRTCIGKNVAMMEMTKTTTEIIRRFDIKLVEPEKPMRFDVGQLCTMHDMNVSFTRRK